MRMNKRLQELIKQATVRAPYYPAGNDGHPEYKVYVNQEKLAELIVAECLTMCDELQDRYLTNRKSTMDFGKKNIYAEGEAACDIIKYKLKKQFGVEE